MAKKKEQSSFSQMYLRKALEGEVQAWVNDKEIYRGNR